MRITRPPGVALLASVLLTVLPSACATQPTPDQGTQPEEATGTIPQDSKQAKAPEEGPPVQALDLASFIGKPREALENELGLPDLTRPENGSNFLRFNLGTCRLYAITRMIEGTETISTLEIRGDRQGSGPRIMGECSPAETQ